MGNLNNLKINEYIKQSDQYAVGCDYIRFNFKRPINFFVKKINLLNTTNSNYVHDGLFTYTKIQTATGFSIKVDYSYNGFAVPVMFYCILNPKFTNPLKKIREDEKPVARLDFYGSFYRLQQMGEFTPTFVEDFIKEHTTEDPNITRYDLAIDFFYNTDMVFPEILTMFEYLNKNTKTQEFRKGDEIESWSVGSKSAKRYFIRMYNKKLDINKKGKMFYYTDYQKFKQVYRFEIQYQPHFTRGYNLSTLKWLEIKTKNALGLFFTSLDQSLFYKYSEAGDINDFSFSYYTKQFVGKGEKFGLSGYNPYTVLYNGLSTSQKIPKEIHKKFLQDFKDII